MKKDKYLRARGGTAKIIDVSCARCGAYLFTYQKDGPGWLKRCYLNRILGPEKWEGLQYSSTTTKDLKNIVCSCGQLIGTPILYNKDSRLAFHLERGNFKRKNNKKVK